jgi:hypothetical protein
MSGIEAKEQRPVLEQQGQVGERENDNPGPARMLRQLRQPIAPDQRERGQPNHDVGRPEPQIAALIEIAQARIVRPLIEHHRDQETGDHVKTLDRGQARKQREPEHAASLRVRDDDAERQQKSNRSQPLAFPKRRAHRQSRMRAKCAKPVALFNSASARRASRRSRPNSSPPRWNRARRGAACP